MDLTREEATAVMGRSMMVKITPYMQKLLDDVQKRAEGEGLNGLQVTFQAALTKGRLIGLSFDESHFRRERESQ